MAVFFSSGMPANDGIGAVGFSSVRRIAAFGSFVADVGQVRAWTVVAVVADLVAREAAGLRGDELARLVLPSAT